MAPRTVTDLVTLRDSSSSIAARTISKAYPGSWDLYRRGLTTDTHYPNVGTTRGEDTPAGHA